MDLFPDVKDLLEAFAASGVRFVLVGGYAVIFHGRPRATKEVDLLVAIDEANRRALTNGLESFGADLLRNKRASGRARDLEDCRELERIRAKLEE